MDEPTQEDPQKKVAQTHQVTPQEHLQTIYEESIQDSISSSNKSNKFAKTVSRMLHQQVHQLFHAGHNFIFELLQNADDALEKSVDDEYGKWVCFSIIQTTDKTHLVVNHNGEHFRSSDVDRICDAAKDADDDEKEETKPKQKNKIGYKGIGFKAVFAISSDVLILSGDYRFCFNQNYWIEYQARQQIKSKFPWQIIPIPLQQEDYADLSQVIHEKYVNFVLRDVNYDSVVKELKNIINCPEIMIFLQHVNKIVVRTINAKGKQEDFLVKNSVNNLVTITSRLDHATSESLWLQHYHSGIPVPSNVQQAVLLDSACPPKIKTAETIELTFAAQVVKEDGQYTLARFNGHSIYSYLPTKTNCKLPYLVNADFVLNQDRTEIINSEWNSFLFQSIGQEQFVWLGKITQDPRFRQSVLSLISSSEITGLHEKITSSYQLGYEAGVTQTAFIPSKSNFLLRLDECIYDQTRFFSKFDEKILEPDLFDTKRNTSLLIDHQLNSCEQLDTLKEVTKYTWKKLIKNIEHYAEVSDQLPEEDVLFQIVRFLIKQAGDNIASFKDKRIIKTENGSLQSARLCFIPTNKISKSDYFKKTFKGLCVVEDTYFPLFPDLTKIFQIPELNELNLIQFQIPRMIKASNSSKTEAIGPVPIFDASNSILILRFIYQACGNKKDGQAILKRIKNKRLGDFDIQFFPVITSSGMYPLNTCYMPNCYMPPKIASDHLVDQLRVSDKYFETTDSDDIWKELLTIGRIQTSIAFRDIPKIKYEEFKKNYLKKCNTSAFSSYFYEYGRHSFAAGSDSTRKVQDAMGYCSFTNFIWFDLLFSSNQYLTQANLHFFLIAAQNGVLQLKSQPCFNRGDAKVNQSNSLEEHFIIYYFKHHALIDVFEKKEPGHPKDLLYTPQLCQLSSRGNYGNFPLNIAQLPCQIDSSLASLLGFRITLFANEGLGVLKWINTAFRKKGKAEQDYDLLKNQLREIYLLLISIKDIPDIKWDNHDYLLANDDSFQLASKLQINDFVEDADDNGPVGSSSKYLNTLGLNSKERQKLATFLNIQYLSNSHDFQPVFSDMAAEKNQAMKLKDFIGNVLPFAIIQEANVRFKNNYQELDKLTELLTARLININFIYSAFIVFNNDHKILSYAFFAIPSTTLYFCGRLTPVLLTNISKIIGNLLFETKEAKNKLKEAVLQFQTKNALQSLENLLSPNDKKKFDKIKVINLAQIVSYMNLNQVHDDTPPASPYQTPTKSVKKTTELIKPFPLPENIFADDLLLTEEDEASSANLDDPVSDGKKTTVTTPLQTPKKSLTARSEDDELATETDENGIISPDDIEITHGHCHISKNKNLKPTGNQALTKGQSNKKPKQQVKSRAEQLKEFDEQAEKEKHNKRLGDVGEQFVYEKIKAMLTKQMGVMPIEVDGLSGVRFIKENKTIIDIKWFNKNRGKQEVKESPVDIVISVNGAERYFIEVKSTSSPTNPIFYVTTNEWQYMRTQKNHSILVRAYEVDVSMNKKPRLEIFKNPFGMICEDLLTYMTGGKLRFFVKEDSDLTPYLLKDDKDDDIGCRIS